MAERACHAFASTTRFGLTQVLGLPGACKTGVAGWVSRTQAVTYGNFLCRQRPLLPRCLYCAGAAHNIAQAGTPSRQVPHVPAPGRSPRCVAAMLANSLLMPRRTAGIRSMSSKLSSGRFAMLAAVPANTSGAGLTIRPSRPCFTAANFSGMFVLDCRRAAGRLNSGVSLLKAVPWHTNAQDHLPGL